MIAVMVSSFIIKVSGGGSFQKAAIRWMIQNAAILPMAYGGTRQAHAGCDTPLLRVTWRASAMKTKTDAMNKSCPSSTPTLKKSSATGIAVCGRPTSLNAPAKPKPCNSPKVNATTHGQRAVREGFTPSPLAEEERAGERRFGLLLSPALSPLVPRGERE